MYSFEQRKQAIDLYIKYNLMAAPVIRELGYPNRHTLNYWYKEFKAIGFIKQRYANGKRREISHYSEAQKKKAVDTYVSCGKNLNSAIRKPVQFK